MLGRRIALWLVIVAVLFAFLYAVRGILLPFIVGFLITAILAPIRRKLLKKGWSNGLASGVPIFAFFGSILVALVLITPYATEQVAGFQSKAREVVEGVTKPDPKSNFFVRASVDHRLTMPTKRDWVERILTDQKDLLERLNLPTTKRGLYAQYIEPQRGQFGKSFQSFVNSFVGIASGLVSQLFTLAFVPIIVLMSLPRTEEIRNRLMHLIPPALRQGATDLTNKLGDVFSDYLRGVSIAVSAYTVTMMILLTLIGAPYGLVLGLLAGTVYLVPYLNSIISATVLIAVTIFSGKSTFLFMVLPSPAMAAIAMAVVFVLCHLVFDMLLYPRIVGTAVGLDPLVSMFVIFSFGALFGLPGMILAFPMAGAIKVVLDRVLTYTNRPEEVFTLPSVPSRHRRELA